MQMERRDQQNLALTTGTPAVHCNGAKGQVNILSQEGLYQNRWVRISLRAQKKETVFNNLLTHICVDSLREAFKALDGTKALGVDGISKTIYGKNLEVNLENLTDRIHKGTYRLMPKREVLIPKANGKLRPLAIACFEDKLVDWVVGKILSTVYEPMFIKNSFGYRPLKSAHNAIEACYYSLCKNQRKYVVEIDFANFFNTIPHRKMMKVLSKKISDNRFKGLIGRFMKGELINSSGATLASEIGTPQGSIMSPILANIYLDEVIDQWFIKNYASYNNIIVRYADDALFFFNKEENANKFLQKLEDRAKSYGLSLNKDKTNTLTLAKGEHKHFNFLGFTFYWGKQQKRIILKVKTQKEKLIKGIQEFEAWIKQIRNKLKLKEIWQLAKSKITGHNNYYGYWMNAVKINHFYQAAICSLYKWLNRRSQMRSYTWYASGKPA
jgi:RNA-directed DNA polymerase